MSSTKVSVRDISRRPDTPLPPSPTPSTGKRGVSEETARAIRKVAADLGYRRSSKLHQVQFVIGRNSGRMIDEGSFRLAVVNGVEDEARLNGLTTSYATVELSEPETARREVAALMNDTSAGIILLGTEMIQRDYDLFANPKVPLAIVDGVSDNHFFDSIVFTNEGSAHRAVNYLINRGHTKIGYIAGSLRIRNFPLRERGYARASPRRAFRSTYAGASRFPPTRCRTPIATCSHGSTPCPRCPRRFSPRTTRSPSAP